MTRLMRTWRLGTVELLNGRRYDPDQGLEFVLPAGSYPLALSLDEEVSTLFYAEPTNEWHQEES